MVALKWALTTCWEHFGNIEDPLKLLKEQHDNLLGMYDLNLYWEDTKKHNKHVMLCFLVLITHPKCA
jgi:hypothetical protein